MVTVTVTDSKVTPRIPTVRTVLHTEVVVLMHSVLVGTSLTLPVLASYFVFFSVTLVAPLPLWIYHNVEELYAIPRCYQSRRVGMECAPVAGMRTRN